MSDFPRIPCHDCGKKTRDWYWGRFEGKDWYFCLSCFNKRIEILRSNEAKRRDYGRNV
jgi:hypothetical protein